MPLGSHTRDRGAGSLSPRQGLAGVVLAIVGVLVVVQIAARFAHRLVPIEPLYRLAAALDRPVRHQVLGSATVARRSGVREGQRVLLLGLVDGGLIRAFSDLVGRSGRVEALALDPGALATARAFLSVAGLENAGVGPTDARRLPFEEGTFDAVCVVSGLGRAREPAVLIRETWRVLRPGGRFSASEVVSDPAYRLPTGAIAGIERAGFERFEQFGNALAYTVNFRKPLRADTGSASASLTGPSEAKAGATGDESVSDGATLG